MINPPEPLDPPPEPFDLPPEPFDLPPLDEERIKEEEKIRKRLAKNKKVRELKSIKNVPKKHYLMLTRFNNDTHQEMLDYCKQVKGIQCAYGVPRLVSHYVNAEGIMFVLEMNNDINKIMGIGMVRNVPIAGKHRIYEEGNYNRFAYLGKTRIAREVMTEEEEQFLKTLDIHCFKGSAHQKRGQGINFFPPNVLQPEDMEYVIAMFKRRL